MRPLEGASIQYDCCSYKEGTLGHRNTQREENVKRHREKMATYRTRRGLGQMPLHGVRESQPCDTLVSDFWLPGVDGHLVLLKVLRMWCCAPAAPHGAGPQQPSRTSTASDARRRTEREFQGKHE